MKKALLAPANVWREMMKSTPLKLLTEDQSALPASFSLSSLDVGVTSSTRIIVWEEEWECWAEREERIFSIKVWGRGC